MNSDPYIFNLSIYTVKEQYGVRWLRILYQNSTGFTFFTNKTAEFSINDPQLFSLLKYIPIIRREDPMKHEFLLEYPGYDGYNRWSQTIEPHQIQSPYYDDRQIPCLEQEGHLDRSYYHPNR